MQERSIVSQMYDGPRWKKKVKKMSDAQVHAIYMKNLEKMTEERQKKAESDDLPF